MNRNETVVSAADALAIQKVLAVRPHCVGVHRLRDVISVGDRCIFHAGPAYRSSLDIPAPVLNSMAQAAIFEGWSASVSEAIAAVHAGKICTASAQEQRLLVPLSGVLSASMAVFEIADPTQELPSVWVALNEGQLHATRLGCIDEGLVSHLHWLNTNLADWLKDCFDVPLDLLLILAAARTQGDDCHARTVAGSKLVAEALLQRCPSPDSAIRTFLNDSPAFALNLWMGATALAASAAEGVEDSSIVIRAGGNGIEFGIQIAGRPGRWTCMPAPVPQGVIEPAHQGRKAVGALGDSAVVDFSGLGGQSLRFAPLVAQGVATALPEDAVQRGEQILACKVPELTQGLCATAARACVATGKGPLVLIGMIDAQGEAGRIGGGVVDVPAILFERALQAY